MKILFIDVESIQKILIDILEGGSHQQTAFNFARFHQMEINIYFITDRNDPEKRRRFRKNIRTCFPPNAKAAIACKYAMQNKSKEAEAFNVR